MKYRILPGHSFRDSDNTVKTGGDTIELSEDVAKAHADKVELITDSNDGAALDHHPAE